MKTTLLFLSVFLSVSLFGQNVYIPDANFKAYLVGNPDINTIVDTEIQLSEAIAVSVLNVSFLNISDLTGIEAFTSLTDLLLTGNNLTSLDVSQNSALTRLDCSSNQLTNLDVSQNTALTDLSCFSNQLTSLDVSQNIALEELVCMQNQFTSLDISQNTALNSFSCGSNQLTSLDVSENNSLLSLNCSHNQLTCLNAANGNNVNMNVFVTHNNPDLSCIEVDDANWSTSNWSNFVDFVHFFSEDCNNDCSVGINELTSSKNLIQILDMMGRETTFKPNTTLIYVYDDGSTEKVFSVEF